MNKIKGFCPYGCGETLFNREGHINCSFSSCPNPFSVDEILNDSESEHIVIIKNNGFSIKHPLKERNTENLSDLFSCDLHRFLTSLDKAPVDIGEYRAVKNIKDQYGYRLFPLV